jgi:chemotaxis protein methyltransferase CheR
LKIEDREFQQICTFMQNNYGINLANKRSLIEGRLAQIVTANGFSDFPPYLSAVMTSDAMRQQMVTKLTTNFTFFERESMHYDYMVHQAIPALQERYAHKMSLKLWSAGCSSGDEAYTASIYLRELMTQNKKLISYSIHATDISNDALQMARAGRYSEDSLKNIALPLRQKYFTQQEDGHWQISPLAANGITFSKLNLMDPFPVAFRGFDIIFCRNVMIYFTPEIRRKLAKKYYDALVPGGYLFIGMSESIPAAETGFKVMRPSVFKKE